MSLGFNYFTTFPVLIQYITTTVVQLCLQNKIYTKSIVPGAENTEVNQNFCKLVILILIEVFSSSDRSWFCFGEHSSYKLLLKYPKAFFKFHRFFFFLQIFDIPDIYIWDKKKKNMRNITDILFLGLSA